MIVVSDASPLHYLILIEQIDLLPRLFGVVFTTPIVLSELSRPASPDIVKHWLSNSPAWLQCQAPKAPSANLRLDAGEAEAIALAEELRADLVLIDERDGARFARLQGLQVTGTLGVLVLASKRGVAPLRATLAALEKTNFRRAPNLFSELLKLHGSAPD